MQTGHWESLVGLLAALCSTITLLPQLLKMRRGGTRDVSYQMLYLYLSGVLLWLVYGIKLHSIPLVISNAPAGGLAVACIASKWAFERSQKPCADVRITHRETH